ncbi:branched-chain amino acid transaminase [Actinomycetota bacterium]
MGGEEQTKYAFFNGKIIDIDDANINIRTIVLHYGIGLFEGIRYYWNPGQHKGYLFRVKEHYHRMIKNTKILAMDIPYTVDELTDITIELLKKEDFKQDTYVRPLAYYASQDILQKLNSTEYGFAIFSFPMQAILDKDKGLDVCVSSWTRLNDNMTAARGKIIGAYVNISLVNHEAKQNGYDDGLILTSDGHISEGGGQNVAIIRNGQIIAPPVSDDILEGITLASMEEFASRELGLELIRRSIDRTEIYIADEVFYLGTGAQITPIISVDKRKINDGNPGPITKKLQDLYFDIVRGENMKYGNWLTPVD